MTTDVGSDGTSPAKPKGALRTIVGWGAPAVVTLLLVIASVSFTTHSDFVVQALDPRHDCVLKIDASGPARAPYSNDEAAKIRAQLSHGICVARALAKINGTYDTGFKIAIFVLTVIGVSAGAGAATLKDSWPRLRTSLALLSALITPVIASMSTFSGQTFQFEKRQLVYEAQAEALEDCELIFESKETIGNPLEFGFLMRDISKWKDNTPVADTKISCRPKPIK